MGALGVQRMSEMAPLAASAARNALTIDAGLSEAHSILGTLAGAVDFDWKLSEHHHRLALAAEPAPPLNRVRYGLYFLTPLGRVDDAVAQYRRALETDPLSMMVHFVMSFALYSKGQYEDAVRHAAAAVDLYPDYWLVHFAMGLALLQQGRLEESIASLETTLRLSPSFTHAAGFLAAAYIRSGGRARADALMQEIGERAASQDVSPVCFATCQAALGQADRMLEFLDGAVSQRSAVSRFDAADESRRGGGSGRFMRVSAELKSEEGSASHGCTGWTQTGRAITKARRRKPLAGTGLVVAKKRRNESRHGRQECPRTSRMKTGGPFTDSCGPAGAHGYRHKCRGNATSPA